jgi:hypothetical protein
MLSTSFYAAILAFHLSQPVQEAHYNGSIFSNDRDSITRRLDRGHFRGAGVSDMDGAPSVNSPFTTKHPPVPYYAIWDNPLNQTATQFVAILYVLEEEGINLDGFKDDWPR